MNLQNFTQKKT